MQYFSPCASGPVCQKSPVSEDIDVGPGPDRVSDVDYAVLVLSFWIGTPLTRERSLSLGTLNSRAIALSLAFLREFKVSITFEIR